MWITPPTLAPYLGHLRSFDRVESLTLSHFSCEIFDRASLYAIFQSQIPSVRNLCLHHPMAHPSSLLQFISVFPNLQDTIVYAPYWGIASHEEIHQATPHILRGNLHLVELDEYSGPLFALLASRTTCYEQVVLKGCSLDNFHSLQLFVSNNGRSLRTLYVFVDGNRRFRVLIEIHVFTSSADQTEVPALSLVDCVVLENFILSVVGPEAKFPRITSTLSSIISPNFRKFVLELNLREFPHIYSAAIQSVVFDSIGRLDMPLSVLAQNAVRNRNTFSFILLTHHAWELVQKLTSLNKEGDILAGERVVGGGHSCVYIPASTSFGQTLNGDAGITCDVNDFI